MAKCGDCLMEAVEVVELNTDGSCPRCGGNYSKGIAGEQPGYIKPENRRPISASEPGMRRVADQ